MEHLVQRLEQWHTQLIGNYIVCFCLYNGHCIQKNNGGEMKWAHWIELTEKINSNTGLYVGNKLTMEHLNLTSYSSMNVHLAAQVYRVIIL